MRRKRLRIFVAVLLAAVVWLGLAAAAVFAAARDVDEGKEILADVRRQDDVAGVLKGALAADLERAEARLSRADRRLSSPMLAPLRIAPWAGRQVRSLDALAAAGNRLAAVGSDALAEVGRLLDGPASTEDRIALVRQVGELAARTRAQLDGVSFGPSKDLMRPLEEGRTELSDEFDEVREGLARASSGAAALSGFLQGPRRYLVFAANNAEMRAGSGMFLSVGTLETSGGRLSLGEFRTVFDVLLPPGLGPPLEGDLADRWGWLHPNQDWRNLMLSPRFEANASLAAQMWAALGERPVDGVVALDPVTLEQLLRVLGPVTVDDRSIDADSVVDELLNAQYRRFPDLEERPERREALGRLARATFGLLDAGNWSVPDLAEAIADSVRARHLMVWSALPGEQAGWEAAAVDGALRPNSLLVSVLNRGGNKLDRFLSVDADLGCAPDGEQSACTLRLNLENTTPDDEPPYIAGPHPGSGVNAGDYLGIVAVNLPGAATGGRIDGVEQLSVAGPDGETRVVGYQLVVPKHEKRTVTVRWELPGRHGSIRVEPTARVPGVSFSSSAEKWSDGTSRAFQW